LVGEVLLHVRKVHQEQLANRYLDPVLAGGTGHLPRPGLEELHGADNRSDPQIHVWV